MPEARRGRAWALLIMTVAAALLWSSALFAILGRGPAWLSGRSAAGDMAGTPAIQPDLAGTVGVNLDVRELAAPSLADRLTYLEAGGVRWLRFRVPWDEVEPAAGRFEWATWDRVFSALASHPALQPLVVLDGSPAWARPASDSANPLAPPQTRAHFGAFAAAIAQRYGKQITYYQIWDEPNIAPHWGARPVDPAGYLGLLREGAIQVRAADPGARIVLAALAPNIETGGANQSDLTYLAALYSLGGRAWFDVVAGEPYGFGQPPDAVAASTSLNFGRAALLYQVMTQNGDGQTALWATAFGWQAAAAGSTTGPGGQVSAGQQAQYAGEALTLARTRWPWLGPLFWPADCPPAGAAATTSYAGQGFALCDAQGGPTPIWTALAAAATAGSPVLPPGSHAVDHPALHYSAGWRIRPGGADPSANGDTLIFTFYGTGLAFKIQGGPYWAYDRVSVDGGPANALPRDEQGAAYLVLDDPLAQTRLVTVASGLPMGDHLVRVEATGGWDQWALQGIVVSAAAPRLLSPVAWLALALIATVAWLWLARPWWPAAATRLAAAQAWAAGWPAPAAWGLAAALGLGFLLSPRAAFDLPLLAALGLLALLRPVLLLPFIAAAIPFWPSAKPVLRWQFSAYELLVWLGVAAALLRRALTPAGTGGQEALPATVPAAQVQAAQTSAAMRGVRPPGSAWQRTAARAGDLWPAAASLGNRAASVEARAVADRPEGQRALAGTVAAWSAALGLGGLDWPVLALLAAGLAATLAAQRADVAWREFRMVFVDAGLFYFLVTRTLAGQAGAPRQAAGRINGALRRPTPAALLLTDGLLLGMVLVSLLGIWQLLTGQGRIDVEGVWRVRGLYGSPNNLALVLDRAVPIALAVAFFGETGRLRRWLYGLAAPIMGLACVATFSKGALLLGLPAGIAVVVLAGAWRSRRRWPLLVLAAGAVIVALAMVLLFRTQRFADLTNFQTGTSFIRIKLWQSAWRMALDHPWLGVGPDNFLYAYRTRYVLPSAWEELNLSHPHNILLDLWTRLGLAGVLAGVWALAAAFAAAWRLFRRGSAAQWPLALGLLAALAATVLHGLIDNSLFLIDLMAIFMLTLALLASLRKTA